MSYVSHRLSSESDEFKPIGIQWRHQPIFFARHFLKEKIANALYQHESMPKNNPLYSS